MRLLVVPFAADATDTDAHDLAAYLAGETAAELSEARLLVDVVPITRKGLGKAAARLGVEMALGAKLRVEGGQVHVDALLVDAGGAERASWSESLPLGAGLRIPAMLARAALLALGEDASAAAERVQPEAPAEAVLRFCRAAAAGDVDELLALALEVPLFEPPRRALLRAADEAVGGDRMPACLAALEQLAEARPEDAEVLLALGQYRALHFDAAGAREVLLRARDVAEDPAVSAKACLRLAALAEEAGRVEEAIMQLRGATRLADDPQTYAHLGALLLAKDPAEGLQMLTRATVLAPADGRLLLKLARALREHGQPERALAAAAQAARSVESQPEVAEEIRAELEQLLADQI